MPTVFVRGPERATIRFHRDKDCYHITKPPPRGEHRELREVDLDELRIQIPCRACYPDAPRAQMYRRFCKECNTNRPYPCPHNGGIPVITEITWKTQTILHEPGDTTVRTRYVWPERVRHHMSA